MKPQKKAKEAFKDTFKRIYSGNNKKMLDNLGKADAHYRNDGTHKCFAKTEIDTCAVCGGREKPAQPAFPLCDIDSCGWLYMGECNCPNSKDLQKRIADLEAELKATHELRDHELKTAREQGKLAGKKELAKELLCAPVNTEEMSIYLVKLSGYKPKWLKSQLSEEQKPKGLIENV